jgi:5-formyltetrahydrofolate cyclo-ligase
VTKSELRKAYLERRRSLSPEEHSRLSHAIIDRLFSEIDLRPINAVHCYIALRHFGEVETGILFDRVWNTHPRIITTAPRIDVASGEVESHIYQRGSLTREGRWKILEPEGSKIVPAEALDLIIVPLLCFDQRGHRVGYGRGFYDRYLRRCRSDCIKAGLSFFPPVESIDNVHEGDIPMDLCVTPEEIFSVI